MADAYVDEETLALLEADTDPLSSDYDEDADAYAPPPPLPDGEYLAQLSLSNVTDPSTQEKKAVVMVQWNGDDKPYPWTSIQAKIIDPNGKQDGKYAQDGLVRSKPDRNGRNPVDAIYRACTGQPCPGTSLGAKMAALVKVLQGNPVVKVKTQLQAGIKTPDGKRVNFKGQGKFLGANGKLIGTTEYNGETLVGRPTIIGYSKQ